MYTMRDVSDAELTSRVQHLVPWVQDVLDQARERQAHLDTLRQQREAAQTAPTAPPTPPAPVSHADLQALLQQAVQQALAAQQPTGNGQAARQWPGAGRKHASAPGQRQAAATVPAVLPVHQVAMEQRSNAAGRGIATGSPASSATARAKH